MSKLLGQGFGGIVTPMITPFLKDETLDKEGLRRLIDHLVHGGVHGIFVLGTTGEATSLSTRLKQELVTLSCEYVSGRVPVLVGITDPSPYESNELATYAANAGASAVVAAPPYYFTLTQQELAAYYMSLADKLSLPLFVYNMPVQTKIMIEPATVVKLSTHPNISGIKDSSGAAPYFNTLLYLLKDDPQFSIFVGPDEMTAQAVLLGGSGGVNSGSNMFPEVFVRLYEAAKKGELDKVKLLQQVVMEISSCIYGQGSSSYRYLKGIKAVLSVMKMVDNKMISPLSHAFSEEESSAIGESIERVKQLLNVIR